MKDLGSSRRGRTRSGLRPSVEALEGRLCLNATVAAHHHSAVAHVIKIAAAKSKSNADYTYTRKGNAQNVATPVEGGVALEGGGTDVSQAFQWMINHMGGKGDFLVLTATKNTGYDSYISKLGGTNSVSTLEIPSLAGALDPTEDAAIVPIIESADAIFITGGAQNDYINFWQGTPVQTAIQADVAKGVPIGGSSAGTDVIGQFIYSALNNSVTSAAALANPFNSDMTFAENFVSSAPPPATVPEFLPMLNNTLVDTHYVTEDRMGRMVAFLARVDSNGWSSKPMGIGINEQTALEIPTVTQNGEKAGVAMVVTNGGAGQDAYFLQTTASAPVYNANGSLTYGPIPVDRVAAGGTFNLNIWQPTGFQYSVRATNGVLMSSQTGNTIY